MRTLSNMRSNLVTLHPYFKMHPEKLDAVKDLFPRPLAAERRNLTTHLMNSTKRVYTFEELPLTPQSSRGDFMHRNLLRRSMIEASACAFASA